MPHRRALIQELSLSHITRPWDIRASAAAAASSATGGLSGASSTTKKTIMVNYKPIFVLTQIIFLLAAYLHAWYCGELNWDNPHVSGVLDDTRRSFMCAAITFTSLWALVGLESTRTIPFIKERLFLSRVICFGIVGVCLFRESQAWALHGFFAVLVFSAGWLLVAVVTLCHPGSWKAVTTLTVLATVTGAAQGMTIGHKLGFESLPFFGNTVLAVGEWGMIIVFDLCVVFVGKRRRSQVVAVAPPALDRNSM